MQHQPRWICDRVTMGQVSSKYISFPISIRWKQLNLTGELLIFITPCKVIVFFKKKRCACTHTHVLMRAHDDSCGRLALPCSSLKMGSRPAFNSPAKYVVS